MERAVAALGDREITADDLPAWIAAPDAERALVEHWRHVPAGPWRLLPSGETGASSPLAGTWFGEFAPVYENLALRNIGPREADLLEIWEVAAVCGVIGDRSRGEEETRDYVAERVAARRSGAPPPVPGPPGASFATLLGRAPTPKR